MQKEAEIRRKIELENKKRKEAARRLFLFRFLVYLVLLALTLSIYAVVFFINLNKVDKIDKSEFIYYLAEEKKSKLPYSSVVRADALYVDFTRIAEKFGIAITGTYDELRFVIDGNEEYVRLTPDSRRAVMNDNLILLSAPCVLDGKNLWVPVDFITDYVEGISLKYNEDERTITIKRLTYGAEDREIAFTLKKISTLPNIDESEYVEAPEKAE